jgi:hypothetical protein
MFHLETHLFVSDVLVVVNCCVLLLFFFSLNQIYICKKKKGGVTTAFLDDHGDNLLAAAAAPATPLTVAVAAMAKILASDPAPNKKDPFKSAGVGGEWRVFGDSVRRAQLLDVAAEDYATSNGTTFNGLSDITVNRHRDGSCSVSVATTGDKKETTGSYKLRGSLKGNTLRVSVEEGDGIPRAFEVMRYTYVCVRVFCVKLTSHIYMYIRI